MAEKQKVQGSDELGTPVDLTERVTMIAPKAKDGQTLYHTEGEETTVSAQLVKHFEKLGYKQKAK